MIIHLDPQSAVPPYAQLCEQIGTMIRSGVLQEGTRLPAIRHLANDLGVAVNTVGRAYRELELDGLVVPQGRHGTVVRLPPAQTAPERRAGVASAAEAFAIEVHQRGANLQQALTAVRDAFTQLERREAR